MNFLAHAFLSFNDAQVLVGNMISDFVKGKAQFDYPISIQKGIQLHRFIDQYTDNHLATKRGNQIFYPEVGRYAGAFMDVVYDHFLAKHFEQFSAASLATLANFAYSSLETHQTLLPLRFAQLLPYMSKQNWLFNYQYGWGVDKSFQNIIRKANYLSATVAPIRPFEAHYDALEQISLEFLPNVIAAAHQQFIHS